MIIVNTIKEVKKVSGELPPTNADIDKGKSEKADDFNMTSLESMVGRFDPDAARRLLDETRDQTSGVESTHIEGINTDIDEGMESVSLIDYSCFYKLNDGSFADLSEEQRAEVLAQCQQAYDASLEEFAGLGEFMDPETGRYNGATYRDGMAGAKRGVDYIVLCPINAEHYQRQVDELEKELAEHTGFRLFGRKKQEEVKREISKKLEKARFELEHAREWPDYIGERAFGSKEKWQSDEIQSKYRRMMQMKKDIRRVKYPWVTNEG